MASLPSYRSGLKRGVFVNLNCHEEHCETYDLEITTKCDNLRLPWVVECLYESDPDYEVCQLLHTQKDYLEQADFDLKFIQPYASLYVGMKKVNLKKEELAGNSLDIKVSGTHSF